VKRSLLQCTVAALAALALGACGGSAGDGAADALGSAPGDAGFTIPVAQRALLLLPALRNRSDQPVTLRSLEVVGDSAALEVVDTRVGARPLYGARVPAAAGVQPGLVEPALVVRAARDGVYAITGLRVTYAAGGSEHTQTLPAHLTVSAGLGRLIGAADRLAALSGAVATARASLDACTGDPCRRAALDVVSERVAPAAVAMQDAASGPCTRTRPAQLLAAGTKFSAATTGQGAVTAHRARRALDDLWAAVLVFRDRFDACRLARAAEVRATAQRSAAGQTIR
jgi:hypothetical protein